MVGRAWVHSHEEDTEAEIVFRPATFPFPPSRGRASLDLRPDGTAIESRPGPTDRRLERTGTWALEGEDLLTLRIPGAAEPSRRMRIVSVREDRLIVRK